MSNEFEVTLKGKLVNGELTEKWGDTGSNKFDQTTLGSYAPVITVGYAAEEILGVGDIVTQGFMYLKNLDDTNFVTYGPTLSGAMVEFGKLLAGEEAWIRVMPSGSIRAQANPDASGDVKVKIILFED